MRKTCQNFEPLPNRIATLRRVFPEGLTSRNRAAKVHPLVMAAPSCSEVSVRFQVMYCPLRVLTSRIRQALNPVSPSGDTPSLRKLPVSLVGNPAVHPMVSGLGAVSGLPATSAS